MKERIDTQAEIVGEAAKEIGTEIVDHLDAMRAAMTTSAHHEEIETCLRIEEEVAGEEAIVVIAMEDLGPDLGEIGRRAHRHHLKRRNQLLI